MEKMNVFIVADNALVANGLRHFLGKKFKDITITRFYDCRTCLKRITRDTAVVILDHTIHGRSGEEALRSVKTINPNTEVIMHTSAEDVASMLEIYITRRSLMLGQQAS
jgi:DNA-binding NtrC family response regulator